MSNDELLLNYQKDVKQLKLTAAKMKITEEQINIIFEECFQKLKSNINLSRSPKHNLKERRNWLCGLLCIVKVIFIFIITCIVLFIILNNHQPTLSLVLRNVQGFIYPGLKMLRLLSVPFIKLFPSLSELYDETCLVENPYFQVNNMECWPCENVHSIVNLTEFKNHSLYQSGVPYIIKTLDKEILLSNIHEMYRTNSDVFNQDAAKLISNQPNIRKAKDLLYFNGSGFNTHIMWRINRMDPARVIRKIFPRPHILSQWSGQSTERFLIIDEKKSEPYMFPNPECSYVFLTQGSGERTIVLRPSSECSTTCRMVSVNLKPTYSLWYNWWYWRPVSLPRENQTEVSIIYMSSYC